MSFLAWMISLCRLLDSAFLKAFHPPAPPFSSQFPSQPSLSVFGPPLSVSGLLPRLS